MRSYAQGPAAVNPLSMVGPFALENKRTLRGLLARLELHLSVASRTARASTPA